MVPEIKFVDATRENILVKAAIVGPSGGGKTFTALTLASLMAKELDLGDVYLIDSENRSSLKYAKSRRTGAGWDFKAFFLPKDDQSPQTYMAALEAVERAGAKICIIDSLTHAWSGVGGILEQVDQATQRSRSKNTFSEGWKEKSPLHRELFQAIQASPLHIFATMRSKTEWVIEEDERGKKVPVKKGLQAEQRKDVDYEFDIVLDMDHEHRAVITKSRCNELKTVGGGVWPLPGKRMVDVLVGWVRDSDPPESKPATIARVAPTPETTRQPEAPSAEHVAALSGLVDTACEQYRTFFTDGALIAADVIVILQQNPAMPKPIRDRLNEQALLARIALASTTDGVSALVPEIKAAQLNEKSYALVKSAFTARKAELSPQQGAA